MVMEMTCCTRLQVRASETPTWRAKDVAGCPQPPMGPGGPLLVWRGDNTLHKEKTGVRPRGRDHTGNFSQVRAAVRHKTLLLLWWIDGGKVVGEHSRLSRQGLPQGGSGYARTSAWVSNLLTLRTLCMVAMGLLL